MELMIFRIILFALILLTVGAVGGLLISYGWRRKNRLLWIAGSLIMPAAFAGIFLLIAHEVESFVGQKAEWSMLFNPSSSPYSPENAELVDTVLLRYWPSGYCHCLNDESDSILFYYSPDFEKIKMLIHRVSGGNTPNPGESYFRVDISVKESFRGDLIFESRNSFGELLSRNAVYVLQQTPSEMSIEFRLKKFQRMEGDFLLLNYNYYE